MSEESQNASLQEEKLDSFGDIQEDLKEMEDDFHALSRIKEGKGDCSEEDEPFHLPHIEQIAEVESESSKKEDSLFKEFTLQEEAREGKEPRGKKIHLSTKNIKKDNESVISFFKEEHNGLGLDFQT